jgi:hypothetical protein
MNSDISLRHQVTGTGDGTENWGLGVKERGLGVGGREQVHQQNGTSGEGV